MRIGLTCREAPWHMARGMYVRCAQCIAERLLSLAVEGAKRESEE
jgi:hypothetical protein